VTDIGTAGIILGTLGAIFFIGPEFKMVGNVIRRLNPFRYWLQRELQFYGPVKEKPASSWSFWIVRRVVNKMMSKTIPKDVTVLFYSDSIHFNVDEWKYTLDAEGRLDWVREDNSVGPTTVLTPGLWRAFTDYENRLMYLIGLVLFLIGVSLEVGQSL
jgi:hypothetical protein